MPSSPYNKADESTFHKDLEKMHFHSSFDPIIQKVIKSMRPIEKIEEQLIHGDIAGNILFSQVGDGKFTFCKNKKNERLEKF
jgi:hypothetical protein